MHAQGKGLLGNWMPVVHKDPALGLLFQWRQSQARLKGSTCWAAAAWQALQLPWAFIWVTNLVLIGASCAGLGRLNQLTAPAVLIELW